MKRSKKINFPDHDYQPSISNEDFGTFRLILPSYVKEERENRKTNSSIAGEYFTVRYTVTMNRKRRRLLLQTMLDLIILRPEAWLNMAEYILLEDLVSAILENDGPQRESDEKYINFTEEILGVAMYFLRNFPLRTRVFKEAESIPTSEVRSDIESQVTSFRFSDPRTLKSRLDAYYPERLVTFTVEIPLQQPEVRSSVPYSSYTKGYGESHPKHLSSPIDWEIDGQDIWEFHNSQSLKPKSINRKGRNFIVPD